MPLARVSLFLALAAAAVAAPAGADTKIASIRSPDLLRDAPQIKSANEKMKTEFEGKQKGLEGEGKKLEEDIKKFQREADTMTSQQRADTEKALQTRKIDFDLKQRQLQEQVQQREQELRKDLSGKFAKAIEEVAKEKGLDLVVQDPVFATATIDITDEVLKRLSAAGADAAPAKSDAKSKKKKKED
jgi:outer membrane protein